MRKGQRTRTPNVCGCGCGKLAPILYRESGPRRGHVKRYAAFVPGHGYKDWGQRQRALPFGAKDLLPLGSTRLHYSTPTLVYRLLKIGPSRKGWRFEHRVMMEQHLKRSLDRSEHVHHKNGNTLDNRIENLELMTHSEHSRHHGKHRISR